MAKRPATERDFESWVDHQISEARKRGEFDNLPGQGKPLTFDDGDDELWWIKSYLRREKLGYTPPTLALRKELHDTFDNLDRFPSERALRAHLEDLNQRIIDTNRYPTDGPPSTLMPVDSDRIVARWRGAKEERTATEAEPAG